MVERWCLENSVRGWCWVNDVEIWVYSKDVVGGDDDEIWEDLKDGVGYMMLKRCCWGDDDVEKMLLERKKGLDEENDLEEGG
ncbi:hypothetical protein Tco_1208061 [Tanacetum coccineum]